MRTHDQHGASYKLRGIFQECGWVDPAERLEVDDLPSGFVLVSLCEGSALAVVDHIVTVRWTHQFQRCFQGLQTLHRWSSYKPATVAAITVIFIQVFTFIIIIIIIIIIITIIITSIVVSIIIAPIVVPVIATLDRYPGNLKEKTYTVYS